MAAIFTGYVVALLSACIAFILGQGKTRKGKYIIWGAALMVPISPALAFSVGLTYARIVHNAWAALVMWYIFPIVFVIGLILLLVGLFKKDQGFGNT